MTVDQYREMQRLRLKEENCFRPVCPDCFQPTFACYCEEIVRFNPKIKFSILIHPIESRKRLATGRMSHLCIEDSLLSRGEDFSENLRINELLHNSEYFPMVLYPGPSSINLTELSEEERIALVPSGKKLMIIVIDGTWGNAGKMIRESKNLTSLPRICFNPPRPSNFRVRKQPHSNCLSTIEAIHHTIELLGPSQGFSLAGRAHDNLLDTFDYLVDLQLRFVPEQRGRENG